MVRLWDTAAQYPLLENMHGCIINKWLWKADPYPYTVCEERMPVG